MRLLKEKKQVMNLLMMKGIGGYLSAIFERVLPTFLSYHPNVFENKVPIPRSGWDKLFISLVSGKAISKTKKANVRNGTCKWADPIYETTSLLQDARTKQYDDKLYKLVVAMGSTRANILGEAIINLADYADASNPSSISFPLQGCSSKSILHLTVQTLTSKTGFREFEQQRKVTAVSQMVNARVGMEKSGADSALGMDKASSSSSEESMYTEKYDSSIDCLNKTISAELNGQSSTSDTDLPMENHRLRLSLELAEYTISQLRLEIHTLQTQPNQIGTHLVASQVSSAQNLATEAIHEQHVLHNDQLESATGLNDCLASEVRCREEKGDELAMTLRSKHNDYDSVTAKLEEYQTKMPVLETEYMELQKRHDALEVRLNDSLESEACCKEENEELIATLESLRSGLQASVAKHDSYEKITTNIEEQLQKKLVALEIDYEKLQKRNNDVEARLHDFEESEACRGAESEKLRLTLKSLTSAFEASIEESQKKKMTAQEAADYALEVNQLSNKELEIIMIVFKDKFVQHRQIMNNTYEEIQMLQNRCSEQILKTQEFRNLSLHFKEIKEKAEADFARLKTKPQRPPPMQESLRIAFIKEQYETRLQELRRHLFMSRKHGEEMLFKLQDSIDEIEHRKKSEALHSKRNEELSGKLLALESDLKSALFDNCKKIKASDELKTKLECAVLTLECCKEEKLKVESSLRECEEEMNKHAVELMRAREVICILQNS